VETCARIYATQIVARHGSGSVLIIYQGRQFTSAFFQETSKILNVKKVQTSAYHPQANGMVERLHKSLQDGLSHYIDAAGTNWDTVVPFFLMVYRATPHSVTEFSPLYLLHWREMNLPTAESLKAKISSEVSDPNLICWLENWKSSLSKAYKAVHLNSKRSHQQNKTN
jgi:transposase InsO family protein